MFFPRKKKNEPALIMTLRIGFPRVTGVFKFKLFIAQLKDNSGTKKIMKICCSLNLKNNNNIIIQRFPLVIYSLNFLLPERMASESCLSK